jgi:hypothetical protein
LGYCNVDFEYEPETEEEIAENLEYYKNLMTILERGEHILPRRVATIINSAMSENCYCFCECKKKSFSYISRKDSGKPHWKSASTVYLYTTDIHAITHLISELYGPYLELEIKDFDTSYKNKQWIKIGIPYNKVLTDWMLGVVSGWQDSMIEYRDEYFRCG